MPSSARRPFFSCLASGLLLAMLVLLLHESGRFGSLDTELLRDLSAHGSSLESLAATVRRLGDPLFVLFALLIACGIACWRRRPTDAVSVLVLVIGASLTTRFVKAAFAHPRVSLMLGPDQPGAGAFPSGHMTAVTSLVWSFTLVSSSRWRIPVLATGVALLGCLAVSLPLLGAHYPSDVLGGFLIACGWGFAVLAARATMRTGAFNRGFQPWSQPPS